jgi:DNA helicase-2/ATP-dependent DNA helicase PcrA
MPETSLDDVLAGLTDVQAKAARWGEGPLLVLAGPGSGKTRVLTARIARLLEESSDATFRILALTFTNKAADEMRSRVEQLVPDQASRVFLGTFHSFCADVLRQHGSHVDVSPDFRVYSTKPDLDAVMAQAVSFAEAEGAQVGRNDVALYPVIERLRSNLVAPSDSPATMTDAGLRARIAAIYTGYERSLADSNALDFPSLIYLTVRLLRDFPAVSKLYRTAYRYWCVDEFQDTNASQYALMRALSGEKFRNVFIVADDDQIIYQWNGASHRRLEEFKKDYAPDVIQLPTNFRCPPEIVQRANSLIRHNVLRSSGKQPLVAARPSTTGDTIRLGVYGDDREEARAVAADIKARHSEQLGRVAVLARNRKLLETVKKQCDEFGVAAVISQRRDSFASPPYRFLVAALSLSNHRRDDRALEVFCGTFGQMFPEVALDADAVAARARSTQDDFLRAWCEAAASRAADAAADAVRAVETHLVRGTDFKSFIEFFGGWLKGIAAGSGVAAPEELFSGYEDDARAWAEVYPDVMRALGDQATLEAFLQELELRSKEPPPNGDTVVMMTVHSSKGKEFHHVYLVGMAEDQMPSFQARQKGDASPEMEEERRNCFVAITRTIQTLTLTCARQYFGYPKRPSRFLFEMEFPVQ